ncbi:GDSL Lipase/Acylhydrolase [Bimuria novae-zelandiae CBS 107.79]|uniref:GDSL Lipase/Acylhydrolase n=1 Tax=Bimuria novae-zelandiae CBS 107.79 TaxID=1447943 RepID=A0A6A5VT84_9PLEO|nr:GDSL Lipase/Acylhydrolase [Bimuria novae-zelandiae CBS 107.79]
MTTATPQAVSRATSNVKIENTNKKVSYDQFIFFGDSITQIDGNPERGFSWRSALQYDYMRRIDIVNRGFSGYNTSNALEVLPIFFPSPQEARVRLVTIFFGANDASLPNTTGQHVPLEHFKLNLHSLLSHPCILAHPNVKILLITPPPIDEWQFDSWDEPGKSARKAVIARAYADAVVEVGSESGIAVVDLWSACMKEVGWDGEEPLPGDHGAEKSGLSKLLFDGLHLGGEGYRVLYQEMKKVVAKEYPELVPAKIPVVLEPFFPEWW